MSVRPEDWPRVKDLFDRARDRPAEHRGAFLDEHCPGDDDVRHEVESLLASSDESTGFLERPAAEVFAAAVTGGVLDGRRFGPYAISSRIGAGGMGEVYKAVDTRLDRTVAIKVLPREIAADPRAHERFDREARAVAVLNHPHICTLYDIGIQDGIDFLVMEFLEGETLAARLERGPLSIVRTLDYGIQIASALDRAHRAGIIHRDVKPGNVFLTKSGAKLLDFGLAKEHHPQDSGARRGSRNDLTGTGVVLGTTPYMSPEQALGREVDARSDLFALGAVLYEMKTGKKFFESPGEPTPGLEYVIKRCLTTDPDDRWQTARDLLAELQRLKETRARPDAESASAAQPRTPASIVRRWLSPVIAILAVIAAGLMAIRLAQSTSGEERAAWLSILPPASGFDDAPDPAVSPDGKYVAYKAQDTSHQTYIWLKAIDSPDAKPIPGTDGTDVSGAHFWSPDSRSLAFFAGGKLKRINIAGGAPQVVAAAPEPRGGTWSPSGVILFNADTQNLMRVPAAGGETTTIASPSTGGGVRLFPQALPDGRHYLFTSRDVGGQGLGVYVGTLDAPDVRRISDAWSPVVYANDHLLFVRQRALFAQPFDLTQLALHGDPQQIAANVGIGIGTPLSFAFSASQAGVVAFWEGSAAALTQLTWVDRTGTRQTTVNEPAEQLGFTTSADGRKVALERRRGDAGGLDVWLLDAPSGGRESRLTTNGAFSIPILSPDGQRIAMFERGRGLVSMSLASGASETIKAGTTSVWPTDWSRDGQWLAFSDYTPTGTRLWTIPAHTGAEPKLYREAPFALESVMFSPDGRWIAYLSDESGRHEIYVDAYPVPAQRIRVSSDGGVFPKWREDGKELYYLSLDRRLMATAVQQIANGLIVSPPRALFEAPAVNFDRSRTQYVPSADGSRFLFNARVENRTPVGLTVIVNWPALMKR
jgi:serine/threonine protein kinase